MLSGKRAGRQEQHCCALLLWEGLMASARAPQTFRRTGQEACLRAQWSLLCRWLMRLRHQVQGSPLKGEAVFNFCSYLQGGVLQGDSMCTSRVLVTPSAARAAWGGVVCMQTASAHIMCWKARGLWVSVRPPAMNCWRPRDLQLQSVPVRLAGEKHLHAVHCAGCT